MVACDESVYHSRARTATADLIATSAHVAVAFTPRVATAPTFQQPAPDTRYTVRKLPRRSSANVRECKTTRANRSTEESGLTTSYFSQLQFIVFSTIVAVAIAGILPHVNHNGTPPDHVIVIKETPSDNIGIDNYKFAYEQSDGQKRDESAQIETRRVDNEEQSVLHVTGSYSFVGQDGLTYTVTYVADENGFQPQGAHLPVA
ncbi:flexible cuticle protein 12-like [Phymastichus coffea]|uniref:flexible cuticle protein 12-like n=1 Tax=Phymastichus coffea TaxID=108790 RepID=UPI00273B58CF|nr:flexible cuticle protein 12-like [Phymastichus coffea]